MTEYVALLGKDLDSDYGVDFPDFPGCITAGATAEEAKEMAVEALCFHVEGMLRHGECIPEPTSLERIKADPDNAYAVETFTVTVPDELIRGNSREVRCESMEEKLDAAPGQ
jgi:predicted RNase H-like HicB family nuclease